MKKLLYIVNEDWFFVSHRLPIARAARAVGYDVHVAANASAASAAIEAAGFTFHPLALSRSGRSPLREFLALVALFRLMRRIRPDVVHLVTIKPVIYGGIAARLMGLPAVAAVTGLGHAFTGGGYLKRCFQALLLALYRFALGGKGCHVVVQNESDEHTMRSLVRTPVDRLSLIPGSGVDLAQYPVLPEPEEPPVVVMAARLLRDKGVLDFLAAANLVRRHHPEVTFLLAGDPDPGNPSSLTQGDLDAIRAEGVVEVCGYQKDIPALFARSNLVVLPSYREGLPKVLIEAAACGRAVITTDAPGCRDAVLPDESALLVPVKAPEVLAEAIERLIVNPHLRRRLGATGRILAEGRFDIGQVIETHLLIYKQILTR